MARKTLNINQPKSRLLRGLTKLTNVACKSELIFPGHRRIPIQVNSASSTGVGAVLFRPPRFGDTYQLEVEIGDHKVATLRVIPVWWREDGTCGFFIDLASEEWNHFIKAQIDSLLKNEKPLVVKVKPAA